MKKILALAVISTISLSCMAVSSVSISINNESDKAVNVSDEAGNQTSIRAGQSGNMRVKLYKQHNTFPIPNDLMPHIATVTVDDGERSSSIGIDEHTKRLTINPDLELEKN